MGRIGHHHTAPPVRGPGMRIMERRSSQHALMPVIQEGERLGQVVRRCAVSDARAHSGPDRRRHHHGRGAVVDISKSGRCISPRTLDSTWGSVSRARDAAGFDAAVTRRASMIAMFGWLATLRATRCKPPLSADRTVTAAIAREPHGR
jgi:hypothetical protein